MPHNYQNDVVNFLKELLKEKTNDLTPDTALIASGVMDSLDIIALIEFIEKQYKTKLADDEMIPANFESIPTIVVMLEKKLG